MSRSHAPAPAALPSFSPPFVAAASLGLHTGGVPATPAELLHHWTTAPSVLLPLVAVSALYARGIRALWARAGKGRGVPRWRAACFAAGVVALVVALVSPVDAAGEVLFSAHMVQHLLLVLVAAPLLVLGAPERTVLWAFSPVARRRLAATFSRAGRLVASLARPGPAVAVATGALWMWHVPALYDLAIRHEGAHALEHSAFLGTALLFWWSLLHMRTLRADAANGMRLLALFAMVLQGSLLGALITFASVPLYASHALIPPAWGLAPLEDQQLAGVIMWVPPAALYLGVAAYLVLRWLQGAESRTSGRPQRAPVPSRASVSSRSRR